MKRRLPDLFIWLSLPALLLALALPGPAARAETSSAPAAPVPDQPEPILVDDFEAGQTHGLFTERKNRLDAFQGTWARRPSFTVITKVLDTRPGSVGHSLRIEYSKTGGWCGWYTLLNGIDVSRHNALTFWVRGERGGERFDIGMADDKMQDLEIDAVYAGSIVGFLPQGISTEWQEVKVPLQSLRTELDLTRMGSLVLWFRYEGAGAVHVDDVSFAYDPGVERIIQMNVPRAQRDERSPRALWIWKWDPVNRMDVRKDTLEFSRRTAVERYYIYLGEDPVSQTPPEYQKNLAEFLRECHTAGIEVHGLQGNPLWALKEYHPRVIEWIRGFLEFNRKRPQEERMDGIHMDIEPYLTQEWETGDREKLKAEFLELLAQCRALIDGYQTVPGQRPGTGPGGPGRPGTFARPWAKGPTAKKPFVMGLAIPLFYNREPEMEEKLLAHLDYVALMDYYDTARDIIEQGRPHLELARKMGVAMVIGVETQDLVQMNQGKRRNTFMEEGWEEMERELSAVVDAFAGNPSFDGVAIHCDYSYKMLQRGRNVPTRERSDKVPPLQAASPGQLTAVDGDLAEWAKANWISLDKRKHVLYGTGAWEGPHDLSYKMAVRWEPDAIVLALDVTDQAIVQEKRGADMWEGDHFEIWFDADLYGDYTEAVNSADDFQVGLSTGNFKDLAPEVHVWVPSVAPESVRQIELAARKTEKGYAMEARFPASFLFQNVPKKIGVEPGRPELKTRVPIPPAVLARHEGVLQSGRMVPGFQLGIMVDGSDCDAAHQPQKCLISSSPERQWGDPTTFNILELK